MKLKSNCNSLIGNFFSGHRRSVNIRKNIFASFVIKAVSIIIGFIIVPLSLDYLDKTRYGIWITVSSVLIWFTFFEVGLGTGLRNKLGEALAVKDYKKAKIYISTSYAIIAMIATGLILIFFSVRNLINWNRIFNVDSSFEHELVSLVTIVFVFFFIRFVLKLITMILYADQKPALSNCIGPLGNILSLVALIILTKTSSGSMVYLGIAFSIAPVFIMLIFSIVLFSTYYKKIAPSIKFVDFKYAKNLMGLGIKFFIIQIAGLILYHSTNIIISQYFGPAEVTPYTISYKLFSTISMIFTIIITPYWSAFTEAWETKDVKWVKESIRKLLYVWIAIAVFGLILLIFSKQIFSLWVGEDIKIDFTLSFILYLHFIIFTFAGIYNMFINGIGKIKLQLYFAVFSSILFYPLCYLLIKIMGFGVEGIALAMLLTNIFGPVIAPVQYKKIINGNAHGIWNK